MEFWRKINFFVQVNNLHTECYRYEPPWKSIGGINKFFLLYRKFENSVKSIGILVMGSILSFQNNIKKSIFSPWHRIILILVAFNIQNVYIVGENNKHSVIFTSQELLIQKSICVSDVNQGYYIYLHCLCSTDYAGDSGFQISFSQPSKETKSTTWTVWRNTNDFQ